MTDLDLDTRNGLPDALRILLEVYPRNGWTDDPGFDDLIRFWLDRHLMFRRLLTELQHATETYLDGTIEARRLGGVTSRYGSMFVNGLHEHHTIEDHHYFPKLQANEPRLERGFQMLDKDHQALDPLLADMVENANGVLQALETPERLKTKADHFRGRLRHFERFLDRHLIDEEDLIVPVILRYGSP